MNTQGECMMNFRKKLARRWLAMFWILRGKEID